MSRKVIYIILSYLLFFTTWSSAQSLCNLSGHILDAQEKEPLPFASIRLKSDEGKFYGGTTDENGKFNIAHIEAGQYHITVSYIGYETQEKSIDLKGNMKLTFSLKPSSTTLNEVVVTASESKGITSASKIDRTAMEHLQPTSFTDLLALLPGGSTKTPDMSKPNIIKLREVGISSSDYNTSALGTKFIIDGAPINTDANMQYVSSEITQEYQNKTSINSGVDMRNISTDNIESVEIIRGIPSVEYADLTSGVVIIKSQQKATPLEARIKADQYSKLFSVGKGVEWKDKNSILFVNGGFLDSYNDPRDRLNNFKRINASVRLNKKWMPGNEHSLKWSTGVSYSGNIDNVKTDPDIQTQQEDNYRSSYHSGRWNSTLEWITPQEKIFRGITLEMSANMSWDKIERSRFIQLDRDRVAPIYVEEGVHDAEILPYKYVAHLTVDGKPMNLFAKAKSKFKLQTWGVKHQILAGATWDYSKNLGDGQVYDLNRPLNPGSAYTRPRKYSDIPAAEQLSLFVEDNISIPVGKHHLEVQAGISSNTLLNLSSSYAISGKFHFDPRVNAQWSFPQIGIGKHDLKINLSGGFGWLTKMPTLAQLYPNKIYMDFVQLNYWNANAEYKRMNLRTYIVDPVNYDLKPARNFKWEVRLGMEYHKNEFSVTYFRERMRSGFRSMSTFSSYQYNKYDASGINGSELTGPPALEDLPYTETRVLNGYSYTGNGSLTLKEGIEFQLATERFKAINSRLTINGAWMRTNYENSLPVYRTVSKVIGNVALSDMYVGLYESDDSYFREQLNTNFIIDTYLEKLGMKLSATVECTWFYTKQTKERSGVPISYIDDKGNTNPYTEADRTDTYKQHLVLSYNEAIFEKDTDPFYMYVNFKATKDFGKNLSIALFADRILDYVPDYTKKGYLIRRTAASPYFGMEITFKL